MGWASDRGMLDQTDFENEYFQVCLLLSLCVDLS